LAAHLESDGREREAIRARARNDSSISGFAGTAPIARRARHRVEFDRRIDGELLPTRGHAAGVTVHQRDTHRIVKFDHFDALDERIRGRTSDVNRLLAEGRAARSLLDAPLAAVVACVGVG
jgi:hypothetical protein